ncbi:MAG: NB-ARC domain-containing protein [Candidatus Muiribacteriota bacterium]
MKNFKIEKVFGRDFEIKLISENLSNYSFFYITGGRGIGKTTISHQIYLNLLKIKKYNLLWYDSRDFESFNSILKDLTKKLNLDKKASGRDIIKKVDNKKIILFIDHFDIYNNKDNQKLINAFIDEFNKSKIFIFSRNSLELPPVKLTRIFYLELKTLTHKSSNELINHIFFVHSFYSFSKDIFNYIFRKSGGNPFLIKLIIGHFLNSRLSFNDFMNEYNLNKILKRELTQNLNINKNKNLQKLINIFCLINIKVDFNFLKKFGQQNFNKELEILKENSVITIENNHRIVFNPVYKDLFCNDIPEDTKLKLHNKLGDFFQNKEKNSLYNLEAFYQYSQGLNYENAIDVILNNTHIINSLGEYSDKFKVCFDKIWSWQKKYKYQQILREKIRLDIFFNKSDNETLKLLKKLNNSYQNMIFKAGVYHSIRKLDESIELCKNLISKNKSKLTALYTIVQCLLDQGKLLQAAEYCRKGVKATEEAASDKNKSKHPDTINLSYGMFIQLMGYIHLRMLKTDEACENFDEAVSYYKKADNMFNVAGAYLAKGSALLLAKKHKESIFNYIKSIKFFKKREYPTITEIRLEYIIDFYMDKNLFKSIRFLKEFFNYCLNEDKTLTGNYYHLKGLIEMREGKIDEAVNSFYNGFSAFDKENMDYNANYSYVYYLICKKINNSMEEDITSLENFFNHAEILPLLGLLYYISGFKYKNKLSETINKMTISQKKIYDYNISLIQKSLYIKENQNKVQVIRNGELQSMHMNAVKEIRNQKNKYKIFVDFINKEALVEGFEVNFFGKSIFENILISLLSNKDFALERSQLYYMAWGNNNIDLNKIRVNISGLKKLFGDIFHYARQTKTYSVKKSVNMCVILKQS